MGGTAQPVFSIEDEDNDKPTFTIEDSAGSAGKPIADTAEMEPSRGVPSTADLLHTAVNSRFPYIHPLDTAAAIAAPMQNYTQEGRAEHPIFSRVGDVATNAQELNRIAGPEISLLSAKDLPENIAGIADSGLQLARGAWEEIPTMARKAVMNQQGKVRLPIQIASPERAAMLEKIFSPMVNTGKGAVAAPDLGEFMASGYEVPPTQEEIYERRAKDLMRRGKEQEALDRSATRAAKASAPPRVAAPAVRNSGYMSPAESPRIAAPPVRESGYMKAADREPTRIPAPPVRNSGYMEAPEPSIAGPEGEGPIGSSWAERQVQTILQKSVITPEEQSFVERILGPEARMRPGEGISKWRQRITGGFKAERARTE